MNAPRKLDDLRVMTNLNKGTEHVLTRDQLAAQIAHLQEAATLMGWASPRCNHASYADMAPAMLHMLTLAVKYLAHPDMALVPFVVPASSIAARIVALINLAGPASRAALDRERGNGTKETPATTWPEAERNLRDIIQKVNPCETLKRHGLIKCHPTSCDECPYRDGNLAHLMDANLKVQR